MAEWIRFCYYIIELTRFRRRFGRGVVCGVGCGFGSCITKRQDWFCELNRTRLNGNALVTTIELTRFWCWLGCGIECGLGSCTIKRGDKIGIINEMNLHGKIFLVPS